MREKLLEEVRSLAENLGRFPNTNDLYRYSDRIKDYVTFKRFFGSLWNAIVEAGIVEKYYKVPKRRGEQYHKEELGLFLKDMETKLGRKPRLIDIYKEHERDNCPSPKLFIKARLVS